MRLKSQRNTTMATAPKSQHAITILAALIVYRAATERALTMAQKKNEPEFVELHRKKLAEIEAARASL